MDALNDQATFSDIDMMEQLRDWAEDSLNKLVWKRAQIQDDMWQPLSGDAGFRQYVRIATKDEAYIAVFSPPNKEKNDEFISIDEYLRENGVHVPKILSVDKSNGFMLLEDLGRTLYLDHLNKDSVELLYGEALMALLNLQQVPKKIRIFPPYNRKALWEEMCLFSDWFLPKLLGYQVDDKELKLIQDMFESLTISATSLPQVIVHRDYHSRNIVYGHEGTPGIIDFQDAVIGPITYDLVSLLRDCYVKWPEADVERWAVAYAGLAVDAGVIEEVSRDQFLKWFDYMGLQRHIKVLGIFARLSLRDGKHGYLDDLPLVIEYVRSVASKYPEFAPFVRWFDHKLMPIIQKQAWMKNS